MASTYTDLGTELMTTGENAGNWGTKTNVNLQILEEAVRGYVAISANSDQTLSLTDGSTGDSIRNAVIAFTGTLTANRTITVPALEKWWIMDNQTAGAYTLTVKVSGQTGVTWGTSDKGTKILYGNGTDVVDTNVGGGVGAYDLNGEELTLDADADTSITASTDDQIDFEIAGADDFTMTANAFNVLTGSHVTFADSANAKFGTGNDMLMYHDGSNSYITNAVGALKIATETSGIAVTIGHTTSEVTIADNLTVTGTLTLGSNAELTEAELEMLDGITAGTVAASKAVVVDSNKDAASFRNVTLTGELDAATLDISGNADIDGTTNLDAVDIDGAVQLDATFTVGVDDTGYDVKFFGATSGAYMLWDESTDDLVLAGAAKLYLYDAGGGEYLSSSGSALTIASGSAAWELPAADGSNGQYLKTDGSGNLDWATLSSGVSLSGSTDNTIATVTGSNALAGEANLTFDGTDFLIAAAGKIQLRDTGLYVASNADGDLDIVSDGTAVDSINIESAGGITLDAGTASSGIIYEDDGTAMLSIINSSSDVILTTKVQDKDLIIKGDDGGSAVTAATFDMSDAGTLILNHDLVIGDAGYIGSASDTDAIAIASNGVVTFSQTPVLSGASISAGTTPLTALDIDGGTDIGEAIVDADLFIVDNGAGGTNRKVAASRIVTYIDANSSAASTGKAIAMALVFG